MDDAEPLKRLHGLHESEAHQHVGDERSGAERKSAEDSRLALAPADGEDAGERDHDRERARIESVDDSGEEDGRKRPSRRGGGLRLDGRAGNRDVDYRTFRVVAENLDVLRELARKHGLKRDRESCRRRRLDTHRRERSVRTAAALHLRNGDGRGRDIVEFNRLRRRLSCGNLAERDTFRRHGKPRRGQGREHWETT